MLTEREQFFYDNAGYSFSPATETREQGHVRAAVELAAAERDMIAGPYFVEVEPDFEPYDGDDGYDGPLWVVLLYSVEDESLPFVVGSMGAVGADSSDDPYIRVVAAELAYDHFSQFTGQC